MNTVKIDGTQPGDDLRMMKTPDAWPLGPVLPLVRREAMEGAGPFGDCAVMIAAPGIRRQTVFVGMNVVAHAGLLRALVGGDPAALDRVPRVVDYRDFEAIVDDGWKVS